MGTADYQENHMNSRSMKSETKSYGPFSGKASKELAFDLTETIFHSVPAALYEHVKLRAEQNLRCLESDGSFVIEDVVGADCWSELDAEEKRMAAMCIGHLHQTGALPVDSSGFELTPPKYYYVRQSGETV